MPLFLVPTPIGNLKDITYRAIETLEQADYILAEDTRTSGKLLKHYNISTQQRSFHIFNEHKALNGAIKDLKEGKSIAMISDAGTPGISDPGFLLIREAIQEGIEVDCLPGATALIPALVQSGFPSDSFTFEGFLPVKKGRQTKLTSLQEEHRTMVFYESPHRIEKCLKEFLIHFGGDRGVAICRELSKLHQEVIRGTLSEILANFVQLTIKGEFVIVVEGKSTKRKK